MATKVASAANSNSSDLTSTTMTTTATDSSTTVSHENEQLWKIIEKQRLLIQDLQKALAKVTADRDNLFTRTSHNNNNNSIHNNNYNNINTNINDLVTTMRPSVQHDKCDSLMDDNFDDGDITTTNSVVVLSCSHSNSSSNSSDSHSNNHSITQQQLQSPVPPPRSPYRQHLKEDAATLPYRFDSLCDNNKKNKNKNRKDVNIRSSSLPVATTSSTINTTTSTTPTTGSTNNSRPVSPSSTDSTVAISSPVNAIMDKDAQLFARYQESQKRDGIWKAASPSRRQNNNNNNNGSSNSSNSSSSSDDAWLWPPAPPPPPTPPAQKKPQQQQQQQHRHVRRASSHPAISTTQQKKSQQQQQTNDNTSSGDGSLAGIDIKVLGSNITTNAKGKGVISFTISVRKDMDDMARELWRIEKLYSDFLALDSKLKQQGRPRAGKISKLPDKALFATHTPNKADQRKMAIEKYLQHMIGVPWHNASALFDFLSSNRVDRKDGTFQSSVPGRKEGYLTKRGKSFGGGWKTRYFVLDGPTLRYYESRDGALQGTIHIPDTQIARQHAQSNTQASTEMRHAFLIVEPKKPSSPASGVNRHLLCAESDEERDQWVEMLTQYLNWGGGASPTIFDSANGNNNNSVSNNTFANGNTTGLHKQLSTTATSHYQQQSHVASPAASRKVSKDDIKPISAVPMSQFNSDLDQNNKFTHMIPSPPYYHPQRSNSADSTAITPFSDSEAVPVFERPPLRQRSSMDHAYFPAIHKKATATISAAAARRRGSMSNEITCTSSGSAPNVDDSTATASTIITSGLGVDIGDGKKKKGNRRTFWAKKIFAGDMTTGMPSTNSIRGFLTRNSSDSSADQQPTSPSQQQHKGKKQRVFGVPLEDAIRACKISDNYELPAVVYRCIEYLEAKNATQEEGIYRLSGSAVKIKTLKQQFDLGNDINLLESDEYHDIHAVAGLLKMWLRELPGNVLTHDLLKEFIPVIDLVDRDERIKELGRLVSMLPLANYTLLRLLCAHLIRVIKHAETNKMNARNVGIIFSPTLQIPAGIFSLFLSEFQYIFWTTDDTYESNKTLVSALVDDGDDHGEGGQESQPNDYFAGSLHPTQPAPDSTNIPRPRYSNGRLQQMLLDEQGRSNRNSVHYMDGAPSSIVGLENGNAIIADDEDVEDLEIREDDSNNTDDEEEDDYESIEYEDKQSSSINEQHYSSSTNSKTGAATPFNNSSKQLLAMK